MSYEEQAAALAERPAAKEEELMGEAQSRVGRRGTLGVRLVSAQDRQSAAMDNPNSAEVVIGASVPMVVRCYCPQPAAAADRSSGASRFEWSQQELKGLRLIPAVGRHDPRGNDLERRRLWCDPSTGLDSQLAALAGQERRRLCEAHARDATKCLVPGEHCRPGWDEACRPHDRAEWEHDSSAVDERC